LLRFEALLSLVCADISALEDAKWDAAFLPALNRGSYIYPMLSALMCPPTYFDVVDQKNPYMSREHPVDRVKAHNQWENFCSVLQQNGCEIKTIDPVEGLEDMVFAANPIFVGEKPGYGKFAVPSRMLHASRQREVVFYTEWFRERNFHIIDIAFDNDHLEGHGDLLWHPDHSHIYAGYGFRSTRGGVDKFAQAMSEMGIEVVPLELTDRYCYHLDTCLCPLNNEAVLIFAGAFSSQGLASIHKNWKKVHLLDVEEAHHFMGNAVVVNGYYIVSHSTPQLEAILQQEGLSAVHVDTSEFEKSGGSCACMVNFYPDL
jgi:N-dimethylarginine dimethylaminohydrolase